MQTETLIKPEVFPEQEDIFYPEEDGEPMAESDFQRKPLTYCVEALENRFESDPDVYVSGNLLIYYKEGDPYKSVAPDVFVVFGVPKHDRGSYKIWEEGKGPDLVIEILSKTTWKKDLNNLSLYRRLGVSEYFLYDPTGKYLEPVLQGYRLDAKRNFRKIRAKKLPGDILELHSGLLGLELRNESGRLRIYDSAEQEYLFTYTEERDSRIRAEARAEYLEIRAEGAEARADKAEEELRRLKEKLRDLGISPD